MSIGFNNCSKILPVNFDNTSKYLGHLSKKPKSVVKPNSAFGYKASYALYRVDSRSSVAMVMPLPSQPAIEYRYTNGFNIYSGDGRFLLAWQGEGTLVLYDTVTGKSRWHSNTSRRGEILAFQPDNNIVIYDNKGKGIWDSGTMGYCGYGGQPGDNGATLYFYDNGSLTLVGDATDINMGVAQGAGNHFY